ncbi:MAG: hypothetical protein Q9159_005626 [Coniocarpon cinnabarinum]
MPAPKLSLISSPPSPYARKVRIALAEKGIPFELHMEVPWDSTTHTPRHNPLEKLPILLLPRDTDTTHDASPSTASGLAFPHASEDQPKAIYESHFILEWLEAKYPQPALLSEDLDLKLAAKQIEVVADGMCDALVLRFFETQRSAERQSPEWIARQDRKISGGIQWLDELVRETGADGSRTFLVGPSFGLADIAAGCVLGYSKCPRCASDCPALKTYFDGLMSRDSFNSTVPYAMSFKDKIV